MRVSDHFWLKSYEEFFLSIDIIIFGLNSGFHDGCPLRKNP